MNTVKKHDTSTGHGFSDSIAITRFIFVRHGQTEGNIARLLHGSTDLPLSALGEQQAALAGERVRNEFSFDAIVSSPLTRAASTAAAIAHRGAVPVRYEPGLREINFGDYENMAFDELITLHPEILTGIDQGQEVNFGWPNGDTLSGFHDRVASTFASLQEAYTGSTIVVVTHNGFLGSLFAGLNSVSPNNWQAYRFANCSISTVVAREGEIEITSMNDVEHLAVLEKSDD